MLNTITRYGYNDVMIQPASASSVEHRKDCYPYKMVETECGNSFLLPIFTAPMSTVVDDKNADEYLKNKINPIIPRNISIEKRLEMMSNGYWVALSLREFDTYVANGKEYNEPINVLIDVANGNMTKIFELSKKAKEFRGTNMVRIMAGNIANPSTYKRYCAAGIDYVRVGIGTGSGCITSSNTAIHDGIASLLDDIWNIKEYQRKMNKFYTKVIADGGIRGYSDVIKALALGADYVMIGSLLSKTVESSAEMYYKQGNLFKCYVNKVVRPCSDDSGYKWVDSNGGHYDTLYKEFYGMASKYGQIDINGKKTKTSEGIKKEFEVTCNLDTWSDNMADYLRSAMSYCNIYNVVEFNPSNVNVNVISNNVQNSINK